MTTRRPNPLQLTLDAASATRAYEGLLCAFAAREAVRPLERRRQVLLAALIARTGLCRRAS